MEDVDHSSEPNRVDRPKRVAVEIIDNFEDAGASKALQRLRERRFQPDLETHGALPTRRLTSSGNELRSALLVPTQRTGLGATSACVDLLIGFRTQYMPLQACAGMESTEATAPSGESR